MEKSFPEPQVASLTKIRPSIDAWGVRIVALLTAVMGVVNLFSAIIPAVHARMLIIRDIFPMEVLHGTRLAAAWPALHYYYWPVRSGAANAPPGCSPSSSWLAPL